MGSSIRQEFLPCSRGGVFKSVRHPLLPTCYSPTSVYFVCFIKGLCLVPVVLLLLFSFIIPCCSALVYVCTPYNCTDLFSIINQGAGSLNSKPPNHLNTKNKVTPWKLKLASSWQSYQDFLADQDGPYNFCLIHSSFISSNLYIENT